ncbi:MAG: M23 family metallopeptidase [Burkholderiaceae bacterium]
MSFTNTLWMWLSSMPQIVVGGWTRDYQDARIIWEQNGDLKYFNISSKVQRLFVRGGIVISCSMVLVIFLLFVISLDLYLTRAKLEQSHQAVFKALISSSSDLDPSDKAEITEDQMLSLAQTIRDRDMSIRRFVDTSMVAVEQENTSMKSQLDSSGLTEKVINIIQRNSPNGGFSLNNDLKNNALLRGKVANELASNRSMREVLAALPSTMPLSSYSVSSDFGVRRHPFTNQPHFHTGVDLINEATDDKVHAVKPGVVVMASVHSTYGKTVVVRHSNGIESLYAHLASMMVKVGDTVSTDTLIGYVGNTGVSTGKHLHLEILVGGYPVNPQKVIRTAQYVQEIQNQK